jgi:hypothetical protein
VGGVFLRFTFLSVFLSVVAISSAVAQEKPEWHSWPTGQHMVLSVGAYRPTLDTTVQISDIGGNIGTIISFESDLGLVDQKVRPLLHFDWRFSKRHSLRLDYFSLDRTGTDTAKIQIEIGGQPPIDVDAPIRSSFDIQVYEFSYSYSIVFNPKFELAAGVGISVQDWTFGIATTEAYSGTPVAVSDEYATLLPTLDLDLVYAITDRWVVEFDLGWLAVAFDKYDGQERTEGSIWNSNLKLRYTLSQNVGIYLGYSSYEVDIDIEKDTEGTIGVLDYSYKGPVLGLGVAF